MSGFPSGLISSLESVLLQLHQNPFPHVPNPEGCDKRASVAVILRVRAPYASVSAPNNTSDNGTNGYSMIETEEDQTTQPSNRLGHFFAQQWVQDGDPEVLFIKRASRRGDRWSGHIALPGGRRDPEDADDLAAAVRETREEIGLDLDSDTSIQVSNLPERVVTTAFGKKGLMVLCPYLFLLTTPVVPPLQLQPTEVAATHWVSLRALLTPSQRTQELVDVSSRFARQGGRIVATILHLLMGKMSLSAIQLIPSESLFATSIPGFIPTPDDSQTSSIYTGLAQGSFGIPQSTTYRTQPPLHLWGLTLGVLADLLDLLPPHNAVKLWKYPTFTAPDLALLIYIFTYTTRLNNARDLSAGFWPNQTAVDTTTNAVAPAPTTRTTTVVSEAEPRQLSQVEQRAATGAEISIGGEGVGAHIRTGAGVEGKPDHAVGKMLSGYYDRMNVAIGVFLVYRLLLGAGLGVWGVRLWRRWRSRRGGAML